MKIEEIKDMFLTFKDFVNFWRENRIDPSEMSIPSKGNENYRTKYKELLSGKSNSQAETDAANTRGTVAFIESIIGIVETVPLSTIVSTLIENGQYEQVLHVLNIFGSLSAIIYFATEGYFGIKLFLAPKYKKEARQPEEAN